MSSRPPKDNLKLSIPENTWFSPHEDSTKKQVSFDVLDIENTGASWTVDIRRGGQVYKIYTGSGSQTLSWDGLFEGAAVPEGKYNIVLKNAKLPGKGRERDHAQVGVDTTPPVITKPLIKSRPDGRRSVVISAFDPVSNGVRSGLNPESFSFNFSSSLYNVGSSQFTQKNRNKLTIETSLTEKDFGLAAAHSDTGVLASSGSACAGYLLGSCLQDMAGIVVKDPFNSNNEQEGGNYCLHPSTQQQLVNVYQKLVQDLTETLAEFETPELLVSNPDFQVSALGDFSIQGLVSCEAGDCSIRDYSDRLSNYDRSLDAKEEAEWNNFLIEVRRQREIAAIYASNTVNTAVITAGIMLAPIPFGAEFGAVTLAYEMEYFGALMTGTSPRVLAYVLTHQDTYGDVVKIFRGYRNYAQTVVSKLGEDISNGVVTCLTSAPPYGGPMTVAVRSQRGMVNFGKNVRKKLKLAGQNVIYRSGNDGSLVIANRASHFYQKSALTGEEIGLLEVFSKPPNQHEIDTIDYIMGQGHHLRLRAGVKGEPDLMLKQFVPGTKPDELPDSSFVFWDMKRINANVENLSNTVKNQIESSAGNRNIVKFFTERNLPHRVIVDTRGRGIDEATAKNAIERALGKVNNVSEITIIGDNKIYSWSEFGTYPSGFNPATVKKLYD